MKIALIQQAASPDRDVNVEKGLANLERAVAQGAEVICFAELAFTPFYPQEEARGDVSHLAEAIPGPTTEAFAAAATHHGVVVVLNLFERDGDNTYDSSPVINTDGSIMGTTRMIHITDYPCFHEKGYYTPGDRGVPVYQTTFGRMGIAICYDRHYPEYMRALAVAGAQVVVVPQAGAVDEWPEGLYEAELQVAAFQNGYFTALCNRVGKETCIEFAGESFVCAPDGRVLARAGGGTDEILICDLDLAQADQSHARRLFLRDRRPELYGDWLK